MSPSALGMAADIATNPADVLTGIVPGLKPVQQAGRAIASTKAGKALTELATMPIEQIGRPTAEQLATKVSTTVKQGIEKAVRPSVIGKRTATQQESYFKKAESAVKDVLDNKANLEIIDKNGGLVVGKNPESLNEALQAVGQTRENIFETYSPMIKQASDAGAVVDGDAIALKLKTFAAQENVQLSNPGLAKYADEVATRWEGKQVPLNVAEQTAKDFNAMLKQKYQQGKVSGADVSSAHVDDMVVRMLRNEIADKAGVGDLKRRYGALAELEGDLAKRAIVAGRQNPMGLVESLTSASSGADIASAVAMSAFTGNPMWLGLAVRGIGAKAAGNIIKGINSPDANIARMFKNVEKLRAIPTRTQAIPAVAPKTPTPIPVDRGQSTSVGTKQGKTPIKRRSGLTGNKGEVSIGGKPQDFATAEEYVASKGKTFIHETDSPNFDKFDMSKIGSGQGDAWLGRGIYLQEKGSLKLESYGKNKVEATLSPSAKIFDVQETPDGLYRDSFVEWAVKNDVGNARELAKKAEALDIESERMAELTGRTRDKSLTSKKNILPRDIIRNNPDVVERLKKEGYDGLNQDGELVVYNPDVIQTKDQLTAEFNVAKGTKKIVGAIAGGTAIGMVGEAEAKEKKADRYGYYNYNSPAKKSIYKVGDSIAKTEASTYGWGEKLSDTRFDGKPFNADESFVAMRGIPMGSEVEVTDTKTGKKIKVKVLDGGPHRRLDRKIDLSKGAWKELGYDKAGLTNVSVKVVSLGDGRVFAQEKAITKKKSTPIPKKEK
jgi:rare lipoprotein A (peptidoglycan hydrolase)